MPQERLPMCKIRDVLRLKAGGSTTPTPSDARRPARADVKRSQGRLAAESEAMTGSRGLGNVAAETDCVAGVIGLELRNPLGSRSARVAGGISGDLAEMAQQRRFALELRRCQRAAAARISRGVSRGRWPGDQARAALKCEVCPQPM
jgi:hypothetical protein